MSVSALSPSLSSASPRSNARSINRRNVPSTQRAYNRRTSSGVAQSAARISTGTSRPKRELNSARACSAKPSANCLVARSRRVGSIAANALSISSARARSAELTDGSASGYCDATKGLAADEVHATLCGMMPRARSKRFGPAWLPGRRSVTPVILELRPRASPSRRSRTSSRTSRSRDVLVPRAMPVL